MPKEIGQLNKEALRDHFAGLAMAAILKKSGARAHTDVARSAYGMADAMLRVRDESKTPAALSGEMNAQVMQLVVKYPLEEKHTLSIARLLTKLEYSDDEILAFLSIKGHLAEHGMWR